jgi:predicted nucleotidyltransferase
MDKESVVRLAQRYSDLVRRYLPVKQVLLYGSYAKGTALPDSDIDIAVIVDRVDGDYLEEQSRLFRLRRTIDLRIEPVLLESGLDQSGFLHEVLTTGHVVYSSGH